MLQLNEKPINLSSSRPIITSLRSSKPNVLKREGNKNANYTQEKPNHPLQAQMAISESQRLKCQQSIRLTIKLIQIHKFSSRIPHTLFPNTKPLHQIGVTAKFIIVLKTNKNPELSLRNKMASLHFPDEESRKTIRIWKSKLKDNLTVAFGLRRSGATH